MTQKELLYVEDAIGHEGVIINVLTETLNYLEDPNLISFMEKELKLHEEFQEKLISKLEVNSNE
ncbi:MAG: hypothetical protein IJH18_01570 [Bacilli bacterium]|nr:hypothetical protein [Bacilli bacterium]